MDDLKDAGKDLAHSLVSTVNSSYTSVANSSVVSSATRKIQGAKTWVGQHKAEIASVAVGVAVGVGCTAVTAGGGALGCAALGGFASGIVGNALDPNADHSLKGYAKAGGAGILGGAAGYGLGKIAAPIAQRFTPPLVARTNAVRTRGSDGIRSLLSGISAKVRPSNTAAKSATGAESALGGALLRNHLRQLEKYGQGGFRELESGRFRYYGNLTSAAKQGEMAGRRLVREWDPGTGATRTWHETLDRSGNVRIVRPETGGPKTHYSFDEFGNFGGAW